MAAPTLDPVDPGSVAAGKGRRWRGLLVRAPLAAGAGVLLYLSFPPRSLWWLAVIAFTGLWVLVHGVRARHGLLLGFLFGLGQLVPLLSWTGAFVGPLPWLVLSAFEALVIGLAVAGIAAVSRLPAAPVWAAAVWVAGEALRSRVPFGGFPWGRVGFSQPEGLFLPVASLGGVPLLSFVTVLAGFAAAELARRIVPRLRRQGSLPQAGRSAVWGSALLLVAALLAGPAATLARPTAAAASPAQHATVAVIQGNVPRLGLDFNAQRRAVLDNHVWVTEQLAADVAAGRAPQPDVVLWPENSSDIDPLRNPDAAAQISRAAREVGAPILVGAVLVNSDRTTSNSVLVWDPQQGPIARNDKRRVQPFGEYMPWRSFFRLFSPYVDRAGNFVPGPGPGVLSAGGVDVGIAICWEIAFDDLVAESVDAGATVLAVPSNNATFGLTEMTYQQLAMSQVRAVEHDRPVLVATTSGVSATITADGTVTAHTGQFVPGTLVADVDGNGTTTLATRLRSVPEWTLAAVGVIALGAAALVGWRSRRRRPA